MTLYYCPLEPLKERYTMQWSAPKTGWLESRWTEAEVDYVRIDGKQPDDKKVIKAGCVLDAVGRCVFAHSQVEELLKLAEAGRIKDSDVILLDDFWHPGIESLAYAFHLLNVRPLVYAFLHAQSVDEFDFTWSMRHWMRHVERGYGEFLDGIFVCCPTLKDLVVMGGIAPRNKVHVTGHPFNSDEVMSRMPSWYRSQMKDEMTLELGDGGMKRKNQVVWSSRFDAEKNPRFFLQVVEKCIQSNVFVNDMKFVICTSSPKLRSNDSRALAELDGMLTKYPDHLELKENLTKEEYYATLCESKVQFNSASQDFVAITLLEASVAGCWPVYPYFRSFPETFLWEHRYMYQHLDVEDATHRILRSLAMPDWQWSVERIKERSWIHSRFDSAWVRMLKLMNVDMKYRPEQQDLWYDANKNPFDKTVWGLGGGE